MSVGVQSYLANCFWLVVPALVWNVWLSNALPRGYASGGPWDAVPSWLRGAENVLRFIVLLTPFGMRCGVSSLWQRAGVWVYVGGLLTYAGSWAVQIWAPASRWSRSMLGFLAPAYTASIWLVGVGLIGERSLVDMPYSRSYYLVVVAAFIIVHTWRAYLAYGKLQQAGGGRPTSG